VRKNAARSEKTSHAGIIRIGFEGISQPHNARSTPVSGLHSNTEQGGEANPGKGEGVKRVKRVKGVKRVKE
jgi:hypothetical protein